MNPRAPVTPIQRDAMIRPIAPARVSKDGKGFSHVEAYDVRRRLIEIFDFGGWSGQVLNIEQVFESSEMRKNKKGEEYEAWTVAYRCTYQLTIHQTGAVYTETAIGDSSNQPSRADAHDMAVKTAESQAFKRAAMNLGSQFGLSLYKKGSMEAIVRHVLVNDLIRFDAGTGEIHRVAPKDGEQKQQHEVDTRDHVTEPVVPESEQADVPQPVKASELDQQRADERGTSPEQERTERLDHGRNVREVLGTKSDGKVVKEEAGRITRTDTARDERWEAPSVPLFTEDEAFDPSTGRGVVQDEPLPTLQQMLMDETEQIVNDADLTAAKKKRALLGIMARPEFQTVKHTVVSWNGEGCDLAAALQRAVEQVGK